MPPNKGEGGNPSQYFWAVKRGETGGWTCLDVPCSLTKALETQLVRDFRSIHRIGQILLVGEDEQERIAQLVLVEHPLQFLACLGYTFSVIRVDDENDTLCVLEVF